MSAVTTIIPDDVDSGITTGYSSIQTILDNHPNDDQLKVPSFIKTIDNADEYMLPIDKSKDNGQVISLWFRTWGNQCDGIPVLFIHGGPGSCVDDYNNVNGKFFEASKYYVVEVDQRGTGKSQPCVRDNYHNMKYYYDISIQQMAADYEVIRKYLKIDKWLVFGGSWGVTLGLEYCIRYPQNCLGLILRGIFLCTKEEFEEIYTRNTFLGNEQQLNEFDMFFDLAYKESRRLGLKPPLVDPNNDAERFIRLYEHMIVQGRRDAIWRFYVYENNLMEDDKTQLLDAYDVPSSDNDKLFREAISMSFFESRLFLRHTFDEPINLLSSHSRIASLRNIPVWIVQGKGDELCPDTYAKLLIEQFEKYGIECKASFVEQGGHTANCGGMFHAVKDSIDNFASTLIPRIATTEEQFIPISRIVTNDKKEERYNSNENKENTVQQTTQETLMQVENIEF